MRLLIRWAVRAIALWAAIELVLDTEHTGEFSTVMLIALILWLVNTHIRPNRMLNF